MLAMEEDGSVLRCEDLSKTFRKKNSEVAVLKGINLDLKKGRVHVVKGRSGTGKSTLINLLSGLDAATSGHVFLGENDLVQLTNKKLAEIRKNKIGIIFQNLNLVSSWTAYENIEAALLFSGQAPLERDRKIMEILGELGLENHSHHYPSELSAGQQQRVAIARAVINEPLLLLADEPTGDLDPETSSEIVQLLLNLANKDITILITTHGSLPQGIGDYVYELAGGYLKRVDQVN